MPVRRTRVGGVLPRAADDDVDREIGAHLDMRAEELVRHGWEPSEAAAEARRRFGDVGAITGHCVRIAKSSDIRVRRRDAMGELAQDIRYTLRVLAKAPAFTTVALLTLGLGIGANTAIFSVVHGVLLTPLPYDDPEELVHVSERGARGQSMSAAYANFRDWRASARSLEALAAYAPSRTTVLGGNQPAWVDIAYVSEDFWRVFAVEPTVGRLLDATDHLEGAAPNVVVTRAFARDVLGSEDPVGRSVEAFGTRATVVGVVEAGFDYPEGTQMWAPVPPQGESRTAHNWPVVGRLRDGVGVEAAAQELDALTARLTAAADPGESAEYLAIGAITVPLHIRIVGDARTPLYILLGAAGFVLLVACTNLASTLLARGTTRATELAVRSALGAARRRLVRQFLTESLVLSLGGALAGLGLAALALRVIRAAGAASVPRLEGVSIDGPVLAFTLAVSVVTAVAFGLLPAMRATESDQASSLRMGRGNAGLNSRIWGLLMATEVALALMLLVGTGLLVRSFAAVMSEDGGFDGDDVALTSIALSGVKYPLPQDRVQLWEELLGRFSGAPGVVAAGLITSPPVGAFAPNGRISLDGNPDRSADAVYVVASRGTFDALDVPVLQGRVFEESDAADAPHVAVVSRSFADRYWPGEDPIGRLVSGGGMDDYWDADPPLYGTVVGVVGDVRYRELTRAGEPTVYWHYKQRPFRIRFGATLAIESANGDPASLAPLVRSTVQAADPDVAVPFRVMEDLVRQSLAQRRFLMLVLAGFAGVALVLATVGIYGVVSYGVARRTREMGIRLALGAAPEGVRALAVGGALRPVVAGVLSGSLGALAVSRLIRSMLYKVPPTDLATFTLVPVLLLVAAVVASWLPAHRGTRVDPVRAMRAE